MAVASMKTMAVSSKAWILPEIPADGPTPRSPCRMQADCESRGARRDGDRQCRAQRDDSSVHVFSSLNLCLFSSRMRLQPFLARVRGFVCPFDNFADVGVGQVW